MPRQRMVKPEFFDSESLGVCSRDARLLFIGLWVMGDDYGNQKAQLTRLQMKVFPYDDMERDYFVGLLCELESVGCIKCYEVDGQWYINVPNFTTYQTVRKPSNTTIPEPPERVKKSLVTSVIHQWRTSDATVASDDGSDAPVTHHDGTSGPERKKEGSNFSLREKIANEHEAALDAALEATAQPSPPPLPDGWEWSGERCGCCESHGRKPPPLISGRGRLWCPSCDGQDLWMMGVEL